MARGIRRFGFDGFASAMAAFTGVVQVVVGAFQCRPGSVGGLVVDAP